MLLSESELNMYNAYSILDEAVLLDESESITKLPAILVVFIVNLCLVGAVACDGILQLGHCLVCYRGRNQWVLVFHGDVDDTCLGVYTTGYILTYRTQYVVLLLCEPEQVHVFCRVFGLLAEQLFG